jgi:mannosyl-3-phosphoglycerate phosphatase
MKNEEHKNVFERILIFTDLDGTMLDHEDYSYSNALPALNMIQKNNIPLIFCTSKTRIEVETIQKEIGISAPFIVENGSAIYFPKNYGLLTNTGTEDFGNYQRIVLGVRYQEIRSFIEKTCMFMIKGFGDMTVSEISEVTGLPIERTVMAKMREFTEPFIVSDKKFVPELREIAILRDITITKGGRFYHFIGNNCSKGIAVSRLRNLYSRHTRQDMLTIGLGDSQNDFSMLSSVDIPVLIPHPDGSYADIDLPNLVRAPYPGSRGWNDTVLSIINNLSDYGDNTS